MESTKSPTPLQEAQSFLTQARQALQRAEQFSKQAQSNSESVEFGNFIEEAKAAAEVATGLAERAIRKAVEAEQSFGKEPPTAGVGDANTSTAAGVGDADTPTTEGGDSTDDETDDRTKDNRTKEEIEATEDGF